MNSEIIILNKELRERKEGQPYRYEYILTSYDNETVFFRTNSVQKMIKEIRKRGLRIPQGWDIRKHQQFSTEPLEKIS